MANGQPTNYNDLNGRFSLADKILNKWGWPSIMLIVGLLLYSGYIPSPLTELVTKSIAQQLNTQKMLSEHRQQADILVQLLLNQCIEMKLDKKADPKECISILTKASSGEQ